MALPTRVIACYGKCGFVQIASGEKAGSDGVLIPTITMQLSLHAVSAMTHSACLKSQRGGCSVADVWPREPRERVKERYRTKVQLSSTDVTASIEINRNVIAALPGRMQIGNTVLYVARGRAERRVRR
jgi:hypothetical protein